jgi:hypothetical protein
MKKLLLIIFVLSAFVAKSQVLVPRASSAVQIYDVRFQATRNMIMPVYPDTTTANTWKGLDSIGAIIQIRSTGEVFHRDTSAGTHKWTLLTAGTGLVNSVFGRVGTVTAASGDYSAFYPLLASVYTDPSWIGSLSATKISGAQTVTAGSSKIVLGGTPAGSVLQPFSIDVVPSNILLSTLGGLLNVGQLNGTGVYNDSNVLYENGTWGRLPAGGGGGGVVPSNLGTGYRWVIPFTGQHKTLFGRGYIVIDSTTNANGLTIFPDTSAGKLATKTDILNVTVPALNQFQIGIGNASNKLSGSSAFTFDGSTLLKLNSFSLGYQSGAGRGLMLTNGANIPATVNLLNSVIIGPDSWNATATGTFNTGLGTLLFGSLTSGSNNSMLGAGAGIAITSGSGNMAIGSSSLAAITSGIKNIGLGYKAGFLLGATSGNNIIAGADSSSSGATVNNFTWIGHGLKDANYRTNSANFGRNDQIIRLGNGGGNTAIMNSLVTPAASDLFYNTDSLGYCMYNGSSWIKWGGGGGGTPLILTTSGTSGAATYSGGTLNIPVYSGGFFVDPLTTNGDVMARIGGITDRLPKGANNTVLGINGSGLLSYNLITNANLSGSAGITNANLATMPPHTRKGNVTAGTAIPTDVTSAQETADLNIFTPTLQGLVPASSGGIINFLRADGAWVKAYQPSDTTTTLATKSDLLIFTDTIYVTPIGTGTNQIQTLFPVGGNLRTSRWISGYGWNPSLAADSAAIGTVDTACSTCPASKTYVNARMGGGGGSVSDSIQVYTTGTTLTQAASNYIQLNPASVQSTLTITTATSANWHSSNDLYIVAGGTVTSGNPVITTLTVTAGAGLTLVQAVTPATITAGEAIRYHRIGTLVYRIN